jgi:hypothetical protein
MRSRVKGVRELNLRRSGFDNSEIAMRTVLPAFLIVGLCAILEPGPMPTGNRLSVVSAADFKRSSDEWAEDRVGLMEVVIERDRKGTAEVPNEAYIAINTGHPYMYAAEGEWVRERFDTPHAKAALAWRAKGLPRGLLIDRQTGVISGRPQYDQAGKHPVDLTATSKRGDTYTASFIWIVDDTNRWPWVDDQYHRVGEPVKLPARCKDVIGNALTYRFENLPPGISFDEQFGFIGTPTADAKGKYKVTAFVTGGGATDQISFPWTVVPTTRSLAAFAINDTFTERDDIGIVGRQTPILIKYFLGGSATGPIKVEVTQGQNTLTTKSGDKVGSKSVIIYPTDCPIGWIHLYSNSNAVGECTYTAFLLTDGKWVKME